MQSSFFKSTILFSSIILLTACHHSAVIKPPEYKKPMIESPDHYKYASIPWVKSSENHVTKPLWWQIYQDENLNQLMQQLDRHNFTLKQAEARYQYAMALLDGQKAKRAPSVSLSSSIKHTKEKSSQFERDFNSGIAVSWIPDLWGRVAKSIEGQYANLQASEADLAAIRLNQQLLAADAYWMIRLLDLKLAIVEQAETSYRRSVQILQYQYKAGFIARADVIQAETQLKQVSIQSLGLKRERALQENILAVLLGQSISDFQLVKTQYQFNIPNIPNQIPSRILNQRPDVIRTERELAVIHAQLGLAQTAWLPDVSIGLDASLNGQTFNTLLQSPQYLWSVGLNTVGTIFDGGLRQSEIAKSQANYDEKLAAYKQSVLISWKEVEDALLKSHSFKEQLTEQQQLSDLAVENERVVMNRYKAGIISYLEVVTAQNLRLEADQAYVELQQLQMQNTMQLVAALGTSWSSTL